MTAPSDLTPLGYDCQVYRPLAVEDFPNELTTIAGFPISDFAQWLFNGFIWIKVS
jgi:hypothetical protein